jgi:alkyldihydroxyacetonephosphate synthase
MGMTNASRRVPDMLWSGWGLPENRVTLDEKVRGLLEQGLKIERREPVILSEADVRLPGSRLAAEARQALAALVGDEHVRIDHASRVLRSAGKSTPDLLRWRTGALDEAPDAVVLPGDHDEVVAVLRACAARRIAVVPFGGGTSVVGGVQAQDGGLTAVVALDLRRLDRLVSVDVESMTATLQAGLKAPEAEELLAPYGLTVGHLPQSFEHASIGGFAATRSAGQASSGYGRFDEMVVALDVATPEGTLRLGRAPASAAGPDLRQLFLGSEGALGVITAVTLRVRKLPAVQVDEAWAFGDFGSGAAALRELAQDGVLPAVTRVSDEAETAVNLALSGGSGVSGNCLAITCYEGNADAVEAQRAAATRVITGAGGRPVDAAAAAQWRHGRFQAPYLRDALLDAGALVETLETATSWSNLQALYAAVRDAITSSLTRAGTPPLVLCHVSHVYPTGASLYYTVVAAAAADPFAQWAAAKRAAGDAIVAAGGTISHHHGVGSDHRAWMTAEIGELGVAVLRAVKATVDPEGILNPGKLIPDLPIG